MVKYERAPQLDKRIANGDDFAGDAWVRYVAVGQTPEPFAVSASGAPSAYDIAANAVQVVADAAAEAFRKVGLEPGEWDSDNIVEDVARGIANDIERLTTQRAETAPQFDSIFPLLWRINDCLRITPDQGVEFEGSTNDVDAYRDALHRLDPNFTKGVKA